MTSTAKSVRNPTYHPAATTNWERVACLLISCTTGAAAIGGLFGNAGTFIGAALGMLFVVTLTIREFHW